MVAGGVDGDVGLVKMFGGSTGSWPPSGMFTSDSTVRSVVWVFGVSGVGRSSSDDWFGGLVVCWEALEEELLPKFCKSSDEELVVGNVDVVCLGGKRVDSSVVDV